MTPAVRVALIFMVSIGALLVDRLFESVTPPSAKLPGWLRALRLLLLTIPVIGLLVSLALYQLAPQIRFLRGTSKGHFPLGLDEMDRTPPGPGFLVRLDLTLRSIWQHGWVFFFGVSAFQIVPYLAAIDALGDAAHSSAWAGRR